ncbi:MAG: aldo/keto reductase [Flavobacteriaceae bacterium]
MATLSRLISGTMTWGEWGKKFSISEQTALIESIFEQGITTFDHADIYGHYTSEALFGEAFKASQIKRNKVQWISKCGIQLPCEKRPLKVQHYNFSKAHIEESVHQSLRHLQTDYLDVLLLHRPSPLMKADEIAAAVKPLLQAGKILSFGVSNFNVSQMHLLQQEIPLAWNQIECSLSHPDPMFNGLLDHMQVGSVGAMAWGALGAYFKKPSPWQARVAKCLAMMTKKYQATEAQLLLAWLLKHPAKLYPVLGSTQAKRWKTLSQATQIELDLQDWFLLLEASMGKPVP